MANESLFPLDFVVKECAGIEVQQWPVNAVLPLPRGAVDDISRLALYAVSSSGTTTAIPVQFEKLERWPESASAEYKYLRHVSAIFLADSQPWTAGTKTSGTSKSRLALADENYSPPQQSSAVSVTGTPSAGNFSVSNGLITLKFETYAPAKSKPKRWRVVLPTGTDLDAKFEYLPKTGATQTQWSLADRDASEITVKVEESGPVRAVIRLAARTRDPAKGATEHGWALRIYVYAAQRFVKLDYQLQNSTLDSFGGPLFFKELAVRVKSAPSTAASVASDEPSDSALGAISSGTVTAVIRYFNRTGPNRLRVEADGTLWVDLFPSNKGRRPLGHEVARGKGWAYHWDWPVPKREGHPEDPDPNEPNPNDMLGFYWLEDMRHVVKEVLLKFEPAGQPPTSGALRDLARTFDFRPTAIIPTAWYAATQATLDFGGYVPIAAPISDADERQTVPPPRVLGFDYYWVEDLSRRTGAANTGSLPFSAAQAVASEQPADVFRAEDFALGELNTRPYWLAGYSHARHYKKQRLTEHPYPTKTLRKTEPTILLRDDLPEGGVFTYLPATYAGTRLTNWAGADCQIPPREDMHAWFYHVMDAYWFTANPWIRDWYEFVGQYRRVRVLNKDRHLAFNTRAVAHSLAHAVQAARVTGDRQLLSLCIRYVQKRLKPSIDKETGFRDSSDNITFTESTYMTGFLVRLLATLYGEVTDAKSRSLLQSTMELLVYWNRNYANFGYEVGNTARELVNNQNKPQTAALRAKLYKSARRAEGAMDSASTPMMDPQAWVAIAAKTRLGGSDWFSRSFEKGVALPTPEDLVSHINNYASQRSMDRSFVPPFIGDFNANLLNDCRNHQDGEGCAVFWAPPTQEVCATYKQYGGTGKVIATKYHCAFGANFPRQAGPFFLDTVTSWSGTYQGRIYPLVKSLGAGDSVPSDIVLVPPTSQVAKMSPLVDIDDDDDERLESDPTTSSRKGLLDLRAARAVTVEIRSGNPSKGWDAEIHVPASLRLLRMVGADVPGADELVGVDLLIVASSTVRLWVRRTGRAGKPLPIWVAGSLRKEVSVGRL